MNNLKTYLISGIMIMAAVSGHCQTKLTFTAEYDGSFFPLDSIKINDVDNGSGSVMFYPDTVLALLFTGTEEIPMDQDMVISQNFPNPYHGNTSFNVSLREQEDLRISLYSLTGKELLSFKKRLPAGSHTFMLTGGSEVISILTVRTGSESRSVKLINSSAWTGSLADLQYTGQNPSNTSQKKGGNDFDYSPGDHLEYIGYMTDLAGKVQSDTIRDIPSENKVYTFSFENRYRILILMYHAITENTPISEYDRNAADFENDLKYLQSMDFQILSFSDLLRIQKREMKLAYNGVIISFDDGYQSVYDLAYPLLDAYGMGATFFVTAEWIGTEGFMTWNQVWLLSDYANDYDQHIYAIGSHTSSHPYLEQSAQDFATHEEYLNFLNIELGDSKNWIMDVTGQSEIFLSLPYGDGAYNQDIIDVAVSNGYSGIRTSVRGSFRPADADLFALPSLPVMSGTPIESVWEYFYK